MSGKVSRQLRLTPLANSYTVKDASAAATMVASSVGDGLPWVAHQRAFVAYTLDEPDVINNLIILNATAGFVRVLVGDENVTLAAVAAIESRPKYNFPEAVDKYFDNVATQLFDAGAVVMVPETQLMSAPQRVAYGSINAAAIASPQFKPRRKQFVSKQLCLPAKGVSVIIFEFSALPDVRLPEIAVKKIMAYGYTAEVPLASTLSTSDIVKEVKPFLRFLTLPAQLPFPASSSSSLASPLSSLAPVPAVPMVEADPATLEAPTAKCPWESSMKFRGMFGDDEGSGGATSNSRSGGAGGRMEYKSESIGFASGASSSTGMAGQNRGGYGGGYQHTPATTMTPMTMTPMTSTPPTSMSLSTSPSTSSMSGVTPSPPSSLGATPARSGSGLYGSRPSLYGSRPSQQQSATTSTASAAPTATATTTTSPLPSPPPSSSSSMPSSSNMHVSITSSSSSSSSASSSSVNISSYATDSLSGFPLCPEHKSVCVRRQFRKEGPDHGQFFYVCDNNHDAPTKIWERDWNNRMR